MSISVDISEVKQMLSGITDDMLKVAIPKAVDQTATQVKKLMVTASSEYAVVTTKTKGRWSWETFGRIPRAVTISKLFKKNKDGSFNAKTGDRGRKVFVAKRRGLPESKRAPHWILVATTHRQMIPTGIPGKGQVRQSKRKPYQLGNDMFSGIKPLSLLKKNLVHQLKLAFKKNSQ